MRISLLEIVIIIVVLIVIAVSARMFRDKHGPAERGGNASVETAARQVNGGTSRIWSALRRTGIAMILIGAALLFTAIGLFRWAFQSYLWSLILVVIGFAMVFASRKK